MLDYQPGFVTRPLMENKKKVNNDTANGRALGINGLMDLV
jgi:hypothetical protein